MKTLEERRLVYTALLVASALAAALAGWQAAFWTLVQMGLVVEALHWLGRHMRRRTECENRI